jgi:hypothetical protein
MMLTGGSHLSLVEEGREHPFGILAGWAVGRLWSWAEWDPRGPFPFLFLFCFLLFSFLFFLISLISFAYLIQTRSNQFLKSCKIQHYYLKQWRDIFEGQNNFSTKIYYLTKKVLFA